MMQFGRKRGTGELQYCKVRYLVAFGGHPLQAAGGFGRGRRVLEVAYHAIQRIARRLRAEVMEICEEEVMRRLVAESRGEAMGAILARVGAGEQDPYKAALEILADREKLATMLAE